MGEGDGVEEATKKGREDGGEEGYRDGTGSLEQCRGGRIIRRAGSGMRG